MHQIVIIEVIQIVVGEVIEIDIVLVIQQQWLRALALYWLNLHQCLNLRPAGRGCVGMLSAVLRTF
jgi:hypothetical protein